MIFTPDNSIINLNLQRLFHSFLINHDKFSLVNCLTFFTKATLSQRKLKSFYQRMEQLGVPVTNEMVGVIEWPYLHNRWNISQCLDTIASHYEFLSGKFPQFMRLHLGESIELFQFGEEYEHLSVVLDRPKWFIREGEIVINLMHQGLRVASIAFTLGKQSGQTVAYIGALQGIHSGIPSDQSLAVYKQLTKLFHGLRPRTLLLEILKVFLPSLGISELFGVSDQHRHHRHQYFGFDQSTVFKNDYNAFWEEHGGDYHQALGFYGIALKPALRDINSIPSKKRSQYKKRNALLLSFEAYFSNKGYLTEQPQ